MSTNQNIAIVGVGALGSHLALFARNWEGAVVLIDFDRIEQKNTMSQFHSRMGLGKNKAQALQQALQGLFGVRVGANPHKLSADNVEAVLGGSDLVIDCTDNAEAREIIQGWVREHEVPCLHGALSADGAFARVIWDEHFVADAEGEEGEATCVDGEHLPFYALAAAHLAGVTQRFLTTGERQSFQITPTNLIRLA